MTPLSAPRDSAPSLRTEPFDAGAARQLRLTEREREHLATISTRLTVAARTVLYRQGEAAAHIYNVTHGVIMSYREMRSGTRHVAAFLFAQDLFGLARQGHYVNSAQTITPATVFRIPVAPLTGLLRGDAPLEFRFLCKVTHALREAQRHALVLGTRRSVDRVAMFLSMLAEMQPDARTGDAGIAVPMSHADIGDYLTLSPAAVGRALRALERRGIIARDGRLIRIADPARFTTLVSDVAGAGPERDPP